MSLTEERSATHTVILSYFSQFQIVLYENIKVYDISGFVSRHPGGAEQIMLGAGRDITQLFESYHKDKIVK